MKTYDFHVREAVPDDAAALIDHVHRLCDEPGVCITLDRDEFTFTIDQERQFVSEVNASDNSVFLVAEAAGGGVIGLLVAHGGKRRATRHESVIAIWRCCSDRGPIPRPGGLPPAGGRWKALNRPVKIEMRWAARSPAWIPTSNTRLGGRTSISTSSGASART